MGVARFLECSLNALDLSITIEEGGAKVRFKCQGCQEAKKFAEHCFKRSWEKNIFLLFFVWIFQIRKLLQCILDISFA